MVMSSNKIGRRAMKATQTGIDDILKSAQTSARATVESDMKADDTIKKAAAPQKAQTFGEAFKAARAKGEKNFTWFGKSYAAKMAGEDGSKPTIKASAPKAATPKGPDVSARTKEFLSKAPLLATRDMKSIQNKPTGSTTKPKDTGQKPGWKVLQEYDAASRKRSGRGFDTSKPATGLAATRSHLDKIAANRKQLDDRRAAENKAIIAARAKATVKKAKGGSIDGCAVRGKTRAPMKKGK